LIASGKLEQCFVEHLMRYAVGRLPPRRRRGHRAPEPAFKALDYSLTELCVGYVASDRLRFGRRTCPAKIVSIDAPLLAGAGAVGLPVLECMLDPNGEAARAVDPSPSDTPSFSPVSGRATTGPTTPRSSSASAPPTPRVHRPPKPELGIRHHAARRLDDLKLMGDFSLVSGLRIPLARHRST
jgi:hypothetical protein